MGALSSQQVFEYGDYRRTKPEKQVHQQPIGFLKRRSRFAVVLFCSGYVLHMLVGGLTWMALKMQLLVVYLTDPVRPCLF
jgi:hypothetical protein